MSNKDEISKLRYWCNKVLPLVYDDSLSYYEVICKVTDKLNEVITTTNLIPEQIKDAIQTGIPLNNLQEQIAEANELESETATADRANGTLVWLNGYLYLTTRNILAGDKYVVSGQNVTGNIKKITIEDLINYYITALKKAITNNDQHYNTTANKSITANDLLWWNNNLYLAKKDISAGDTLSDKNLQQVTLESVISSSLTESKEYTDNKTTESKEYTDNKTTEVRTYVNASVEELNNKITSLKTNVDTSVEELNNNITNSLTQSKNYTDGQITDLRRDVDGSFRVLQEEINNIDTADEYIIISDSYGETRDGTSWITIISGLLGANKCHSAYQGGYGFAPAYNTNNSFISLLKGISGISDISKIKKIIVAGGFNDRLQTTDKILTAINEFTQYAKTTYPNAVVLIAGVGWSFNSEYVQELNLGHYLEAYKRCGECGASYIIGSENIMHNKDLFYEEPASSDLTLGHQYVHPNASGSKMIAGAIYGAITGNNGCSVHFDPIDITLVPAEGVTITSATFKQSQDNNLIMLNLLQSIFQIPSTAFNYSANAVKLATITNGFIAGGLSVGFGVNTSGFVAGGTATGNQQVPIRLAIRGNELYAYALEAVTATALCFYDTTAIYSVVEA